MKNTGSASETDFEDMMLAKYGLKAFVYRIEDAKAAFGRNKGLTITAKRPSDYIVTAAGEMFYAEVKSSTDLKGKKPQLQTGQAAAMMRQIAAGGNYYVFLHSIVHGKWYMIEARDLPNIKSWNWSKLGQFEYS